MTVVVIDCCISELCPHKTSQQHNSVSSRPLMLIFWGSVNCYIVRWLLKYWSMKHWGDFVMTVIVIDCCISELSCHTTLQQHNSVGSCPMMLIFWGSVDCYIFRWLLKYWSTKHWGDFGMTVVAIDDCISNFENCYLVCCCELLLEGIFGIPLGGLGAQVWIFSRVRYLSLPDTFPTKIASFGNDEGMHEKVWKKPDEWFRSVDSGCQKSGQNVHQLHEILRKCPFIMD